MKSLNFIILFLHLTTLAACGSNENDTTRITVNTMFPVKSPASADLSKTMFSMFAVPTPNCVQDQIMLGARNAVTKEMIQMKRVLLRTKLVTTNEIGYDATTATAQISDINSAIYWLKNYSEVDAPLFLNIPRGISVEIGLFGHFFRPTDLDNNGICDQTAAGGSNALFSSVQSKNRQNHLR